jgi:hypothetical protein
MQLWICLLGKRRFHSYTCVSTDVQPTSIVHNIFYNAVVYDVIHVIPTYTCVSKRNVDCTFFKVNPTVISYVLSQII